MLARPDPNNTSVPAPQCRLLRAMLFLDTPGEICYKPKGQGRPGASWTRLALEDQ